MVEACRIVGPFALATPETTRAPRVAQEDRVFSCPGGVEGTARIRVGIALGHELTACGVDGLACGVVGLGCGVGVVGGGGGGVCGVKVVGRRGGVERCGLVRVGGLLWLMMMVEERTILRLGGGCSG